MRKPNGIKLSKRKKVPRVLFVFGIMLKTQRFSILNNFGNVFFFGAVYWFGVSCKHAYLV